jgi:carbamoyl-phosphate synthase large subunit
MPKRTDIKSILIIGAGPIVIGQACEFDYAGTQACKALKAAGYKIILVNSNPATIMTDPDLADVTYIEPINVDFITNIIARERPDALLPTLGGQTALNVTLALADAGVLEKYQVEIIGASLSAIKLAENRTLFRAAMQEINLAIPQALSIYSMQEAQTVAAKLQYPVLVRSSFALGGSGAGFAHDQTSFLQQCTQAFAVSPQQEITVDEALLGWKEYELEVVRDKNDNCIVVCGIENFDPLGIHTGDSIAVAPIQTLSDKEYQMMRQAAFTVLRKVGVETGGSNVQFAVHPQTGRMVVIEMNPRVSRSSALVSKASGFPIAKIAAKLAVGYTLDELKNDITGDQLPASFEPSLDYVVVKIPKFNVDKFPQQHTTRGAQMRSVGEVMAIGRTFAESLLKAMRSIEVNAKNLLENIDQIGLETILTQAHPLQLWAIFAALQRGYTLENLIGLTHIDAWFLYQIQELVIAEKALQISALDKDTLYFYKRLGFSDQQIAARCECSEAHIYALRKQWQIFPVYKRVDSCAGEFFTPSAYLYSTYETVSEIASSDKNKVIVIGSGANRIGQGIEFDYCCVHAAKALHALGYETIMLNCNPETVSTDVDVVDKLYCTPLTFEDVYAIIQAEAPLGVCVQFGGQTPLALAEKLAAAGVNLFGVDIEKIQRTEDRQAFQTLIKDLHLHQPKNVTANSVSAGLVAAQALNFPLIVRPSFVLGGSAMQIVQDEATLKLSLENIFNQHQANTVLIETFLSNATEVDVDAIADGKEVYICGVLEHVEPAGVHSGDSACIIPSVSLSAAIQEKIITQTKCIAQYLKLQGIFNIQFAVQNNEVYIIEVNPRASRTLPFLCKVTGLPLVEIALQCALGVPLAQLSIPAIQLKHYYVKEAVLPFNKFPGASVCLGPEMKSTGEVMGIGASPQEAYAKAQIASFNLLPETGNVWICADPQQQLHAQKFAKKLQALGFNVYFNLPQACVLVIALSGVQPSAVVAEALQMAVEKKLCYTSTHNAAQQLIQALAIHQRREYHMQPLQNLHQQNQVSQTSHSALKHLFTGAEFSTAELHALLHFALQLKQDAQVKKSYQSALTGKQLALIFDKASLRTRFSFTRAMRDLGGDVIESISDTRKVEEPEDLARVLNGYCDALMVRTDKDEKLIKMQKVSRVPIINGLTDLHHPCQILADLLTLLEHFKDLSGLCVSYIGDGNNILHSLLLLAPRLGVSIHYCCPPGRQPDAEILLEAQQQLKDTNAHITAFNQPKLVVQGAHAVYTDVWTSMGFTQVDENLFAGFQVNEALMQEALPNAIFMHCLPMERGKEVSTTLPDQPSSMIFAQSENRLHIQKAILLTLFQAVA